MNQVNLSLHGYSDRSRSSEIDTQWTLKESVNCNGKDKHFIKDVDYRPDTFMHALFQSEWLARRATIQSNASSSPHLQLLPLHH